MRASPVACSKPVLSLQDRRRREAGAGGLSNGTPTVTEWPPTDDFTKAAATVLQHAAGVIQTSETTIRRAGLFARRAEKRKFRLVVELARELLRPPNEFGVDVKDSALAERYCRHVVPKIAAFCLAQCRRDAKDVGYPLLEAFGDTISRELPRFLTRETANDCLYPDFLVADR